MKCTICKTGKTIHSKVNVTLHRNDSVVVIKNVPADVCENCAEYFLNEQMSRLVMERAEVFMKSGEHEGVIRFEGNDEC